MKIIALLLLFLPAFSQAGTPKTFRQTSISLSAKQVAASKKTTNDFVTSWGSYDKTFARWRSVEIDIRNFSAKNDFTGYVRMYWLGRKGPGGGDRILAGQPSTEKVSVTKGATQKFDSDSGLVSANDMNLKAIGYRSTGGTKLEGWIVILYDENGVPLATKGSAPAIEDDYKQGFLDAIIPDFKPTAPPAPASPAP